MPYREEEQVRLKRQNSKLAIALAMQGRWREAVAINMDIIGSFPNDVDAHNRLGKAYMELGEYAQAREAYHRAIELDPLNAIAQKNLRRLAHLEEAAVSPKGGSELAEPQSFIGEVGKAEVVNLYRLAPPAILARMVAGDRVYLKRKEAGLIVENGRGEYLGEVEARHAQRLLKLMLGGNRYTAAIVSSNEGMVTVIIREVYQEPSQAGQLSFPGKGPEEPRSHVGDMIIKRELAYEEEAVEEPGYIIIDEEGVEVPLKEPLDSGDDKPEDEE